MKAAPVIATALALASVMVRVDVPAMPIGFGANDLVMVGCASTLSVAEALGAVPAFVVVTLPVLLRYTPAAALDTFTVTLQEPLAGTVPPASATLLALPAAVTTPAPQLVVPAGAPVLTRPAG